MFKKGVITDEISQDFEAAVRLASQYRLDGIEIRSVWDKGPHELDNGEIGLIDRIAKDAGLKVCGISSPFYKCSMEDEAEINEHIEILKRCIDLAHKVGTNIVRGFTFWKNGAFDESFEKLLSRYEKPLEILKSEGIMLALEHDPSVFASNAQKLVKVIKGINSAYVRALWDPGNDIYDPDCEVPYPTGYEIIRPYMVHMHLKDAVRMPDGKASSVPVGTGQVDYRGQFKALVENNYEGYVVLETHYRPKHEISEELMALPKGSAFSYLGYEASEECLVNWDGLLEEIKPGDR